MASCLVIQHVEPEKSFAIGDTLADAGIEVVTRLAGAGESLPDHLGDFDGLVVMGGPMSAAHDEGFASRPHELALLRQALDLDVPTLGICLGAQLLATAAGGRVVPGRAGLEIGWGMVQLAPAAADDELFAGIAGPLTVLHWHGDTYELPSGPVRLASSPTYAEQAFRAGSRAWGLQFHLEVDAGAVAAFADAFPTDLAAAGTDAAALDAATVPALAALAEPRRLLLERFAGLVGAGRGAVLADRLTDPA